MSRSDARVVNPDQLKDYGDWGPTHAFVQEDGTLHISGQVAMNSENEVVGHSIKSQARRTFENIGYILDEVGKDFGDVMKLTSYVANAEENMPQYLEFVNEFFEAPNPCHTAFGVDGWGYDDRKGEPSNFLVEVEFELDGPIDPEYR